MYKKITEIKSNQIMKCCQYCDFQEPNDNEFLAEMVNHYLEKHDGELIDISPQQVLGGISDRMYFDIRVATIGFK